MTVPEPTPEQLQSFLTAAKTAARLGGDELLQWMGKTNVTNKGPRDFVTEADLASQRVVTEFLLREFPDHQLLGEEDLTENVANQEESGTTELGGTGAAAKSESYEEVQQGFWWIVDPLDGTTNYVHQLPGFSVSIGLYWDGEPLVGVVWDPLLKEMFTAVRGQGASRNGEPISVSECTAIDRAMVVISLSKGVTRGDQQMGQLIQVLETVGSIRRLGSAALNLCYVGMGRVDIYWANSLKPWDTAAGSLIALESGAVIKPIAKADESDSKDSFTLATSNFICGCNEPLRQQMEDMLHAAAEIG
ncbi:MAG: inositol monophosphatase family protein [Planctomycetota bacterium]